MINLDKIKIGDKFSKLFGIEEDLDHVLDWSNRLLVCNLGNTSFDWSNRDNIDSLDIQNHEKIK